MKQAKIVGVAALWILTCGQAFAWAALAVGDGDITFISYNNATRSEARAKALEGCSGMGAGCRLSGDAVHSTALVLAKGRGGTGHAAQPDPVAAARLALSQCRQVARDCKVVYAVWDQGQTWGALALGAASFYTVVNASGQADAESSAIAGCEKNAGKPGSCKIHPGSVSSQRTFYARAATKTFTGFGLSPTDAEAKRIAMESCNEGKDAGQTCALIEVIRNDGPATEPAAMKEVLASIEESEVKVAPKRASTRTTSTNVLRCSNRCVNGMCLRTFENGRKEKWRAPRVFNPATSNWEWDINTNACGG